MNAAPGQAPTGHGHVIPRPDGVKARCGGPALCSTCAKELAAIAAQPQPAPGHMALIAELSEALAEAARHVEPVDQNSELAIGGWLELAKRGTEEIPQFAQPAPARKVVLCGADLPVAQVDYTMPGHPWKVHEDGTRCDHPGGVRIGERPEPQRAPELQAVESVYLYHWRFALGEEFGLYRHKADANAKAAEHAGDGLSEVLGMAILGRPEQPAPELAAAMAESRQLRTALRTLADLWDASSDKDEETARRPNRARLVIEERATTRRACAADIRKLAGPEGK